MAFIPNPRFIPELRDEDETKAMLEGAAEKAKEIAQQIAPYDAMGGAYTDTEGHYRDKFVVVEDEKGEVTLGNTNYKAHWIEWGTSGGGRGGNVSTPAFATIRRAVIAAGYRLDESD